MIKEFDQDEELNEEGYHDLMQLVRLHVDKITWKIFSDGSTFLDLSFFITHFIDSKLKMTTLPTKYSVRLL